MKIIIQMQKIADVIVTTIANWRQSLISRELVVKRSNAQHITGDIVGRLPKSSVKLMQQLTLTVVFSYELPLEMIMVYDELFARQVKGLGKEERYTNYFKF